MVVRVILLNGPGSVGKSSIARALQEILAEPFLHVPMDIFLEMLPAALQGGDDGLRYEVSHRDGAPWVAVEVGPVARRLIEGMHGAVLAMAAAGNALILDDVLLDGALVAYAGLAPFGLFKFGPSAPLSVLEGREKARGDRMIGLSRAQQARVHQGKRYDWQNDTSRGDALVGTRMIAQAAGLVHHTGHG